jgi:uncharacterized protein (TIGR03083 family)
VADGTGLDDLTETGRLYHDVRERITALVGTLDDAQLDAPVPACPKWRVRDVIAHLAGVCDDGLNGKMEGAPGEAWTARQVEARRDVGVPDVLAAWARDAAPFERIPLPFQAVADVASHEQDIRGALGQPGASEGNPAIEFVVPIMLDRLAQRLGEAGLGPIAIVTDRTSVMAGADRGGPVTRLEISDFEFFRAVFGRRSRAQLAALAWTGDPAPYLDELCFFGPAEHDVIE